MVGMYRPGSRTNPRPRLEPRIASLEHCTTNTLVSDTPVYSVAGVWVGGSYSIGGL